MSNSIVVDLPDNLTIATADALHEQLEPILSGSEDVVLNAADVSRADTAGLQTLLAFANALMARSANLSWSSPSKPLLETAQQLGMTKILALDSTPGR